MFTLKDWSKTRTVPKIKCGFWKTSDTISKHLHNVSTVYINNNVGSGQALYLVIEYRVSFAESVLSNTFRIFFTYQMASRGGAVIWDTALQAGRSRVRFPMVSLTFFHWHNPFCRTMVESASNRNEYQEYFLGGKGGRCAGLTTLPPSCADCLEIWEPQPTGTLRACLGL
jgi:hypothetical protein